MRYLVQALGTLAKPPVQGARNEVNAAKDYNTFWQFQKICKKSTFTEKLEFYLVKLFLAVNRAIKTPKVSLHITFVCNSSRFKQDFELSVAVSITLSVPSG